MNERALKIVDDCVEKIRQQCIEYNQSRYGYNTLYMAITSNNDLRVSKTKDILLDAQRCYIIHRWMGKAVTHYYDTFLVESVNECGEVGGGELDENFSFKITNASWSYWADVQLYRKGELIYSDHIWKGGVDRLSQLLEFVWRLYRKCRTEGTTQFECELLGKIATQENTIEDLEDKLANSDAQKAFIEEEMKQYRSILDEIKVLLEK